MVDCKGLIGEEIQEFRLRVESDIELMEGEYVSDGVVSVLSLYALRVERGRWYAGKRETELAGVYRAGALAGLSSLV